MRKMRLDKLLSMNGLTRSQAAALVRGGAVTVNGSVAASPPLPVDADADTVCLNGQPLRTDAQLHVMIHKPAGCLTATEDPSAPTVMDLLPELYRKRGVGPVGRLDKDVTGLVIMTTDGQLAHRLISPKWERDKLYEAEVEGPVGGETVRLFGQGVPLRDFTCLPARLTVLRSGETSLCEVVVQEGKFHQVKRMFAAAGHPVLRLHRRAVAGLELDPALAPGQWRELTKDERARLYQAAGMEEE